MSDSYSQIHLPKLRSPATAFGFIWNTQCDKSLSVTSLLKKNFELLTLLAYCVSVCVLGHSGLSRYFQNTAIGDSRYTFFGCIAIDYRDTLRQYR